MGGVIQKRRSDHINRVVSWTRSKPFGQAASIEACCRKAHSETWKQSLELAWEVVVMMMVMSRRSKTGVSNTTSRGSREEVEQQTTRNLSRP